MESYHKIFICILQLAIILLFASCDFSNKTNPASGLLDIKLDSIIINSDTLTHSYYDKVFDAYSLEDKHYLIGYSKPTHSIAFKNISDAKIEKHIFLELKGPDGISPLDGLYYHNLDTIFLYSPGFIYMVNHEGNLKKRVNLGSLLNDSLLYGFPITSQYFRLNYNSKSKEIYLYRLISANLIEEKLSDPLIISLKLDKNELLLHSFKIPSSLKKSYPYSGYINWLNFYGFNDQNYLILNFQYRPEIFLYNPFNGEISTHTGNSKFFRNKSSSLVEKTDHEKWTTHALENTHFFGVFYDSTNSAYYRINWGNIDYLRKDGKYNWFTDKKFSISIFNNNLKFIQEKQIDDIYMLPNTWFFLDNRIYFNRNYSDLKSLESDVIKLYYYEFHIP